MKVKIEEFENDFDIVLTAETVEDAARLARLSKNAIRKSAQMFAFANRAGEFNGRIMFDAKKNVSGLIK